LIAFESAVYFFECAGSCGFLVLHLAQGLVVMCNRPWHTPYGYGTWMEGTFGGGEGYEIVEGSKGRMAVPSFPWDTNCDASTATRTRLNCL